MSRYGDAIRKISRYEQLLKMIRELGGSAEQDNKLGIGSVRSIAYLDNKDLKSIQQAATSGATKPTQVTDGQTSATNSAVSNASALTSQLKAGTSQAITPNNPLNAATTAGSTSALSSLDNTERSGWYSAGSLLDNTTDQYNKAPPLLSNGEGYENNTYTGDTVTAINDLTDGTRDYILYLTDAVNSFIGPADWNSLTDRPVEPTYTAGRVWALISGFTKYFGTSLGELVAVREALDGSKCYTVAGGLITSTTYTNGEQLRFSLNHSGAVGDAAGTVGGVSYGFQAYSSGVAVSIGGYGQQDCGLSVGDTAACSADPPVVSSWADLGVTQLAWVTPYSVQAGLYGAEYIGRFMGYPADRSNIPAVYLDGASIIDLQTQTSGKNIRIGPLGDGGWYMYERNLSTGLPLSADDVYSVLLLRSNRTIAGFITPSELGKRLPAATVGIYD